MQSGNQASIPDQIISVTNSIEEISNPKIREDLILLINELINKDFQSLIQLLYRIDVDEKKIRVYLEQQQNEDSAPLLADLIIERQSQKIASRKYFSSKKYPESDEEKW